jgi:DNA-binding transcriptional regulator YbjK
MPPDNRLRLTPDERREIIVQAAVRLTQERASLYAWSRQDVADACEIPTTSDTVKHYFTMPDLREAVAGRLPVAQ